ncbi:MAG: L,D-transpeptidase family protein [Ornithinimicrobium sp.]
MHTPQVVRASVCALVLSLTAGCSSDSSPEQANDTAPSTVASPSLKEDAPSTVASRSLKEDAPSTVASPSPKEDAQASATQAPVEPESTLAATAVGDEVVVLEDRDGDVLEELASPTTAGVPLTFMVLSTDDDWVRVQVPVRPNGTTGWVAAQDVTLAEVPYRLEVDTADNTLDFYDGGSLVETFSVASGTGETPTPLGTFYLTELIEPTNPGYGSFAYGISAFSDVLNEFKGGPGQIGLHGTNVSDSIGQSVSHGCIRLANEDIEMLAELLPLGTPIVIT